MLFNKNFLISISPE